MTNQATRQKREHTVKFITQHRLTRTAIAAAIAITTLAIGTPAEAAPPIRVDFTVHETLPVSTDGDLIDSNIPECGPAPAAVTTGPVSVTTNGPRTRFSGTKVIDCGGGNTITISYRAWSSECRPNDRGRWRVVDGTGVFTDATGRGRLVGSYTLGSGDGTFCDNDGIDDRYTGRIRLAD